MHYLAINEWGEGEMEMEDIHNIKTKVLTEIYDAKKTDRKPQSIKASPENYHLFLIAFMHQLMFSERGIELFGIPFEIDREIVDVKVFVD